MIQPRNTQQTAAPPTAAPPRQRRLTVVTFGFKYGSPQTNYYFDVSFIKNPAREPEWGLFARPCERMRRFVLDQPDAQKFLDHLVPLARVLMELDDDVRIGLGCSSGRHRSFIIAEELQRRLEDDHTRVRLVHREEQYQ